MQVAIMAGAEAGNIPGIAGVQNVEELIVCRQTDWHRATRGNSIHESEHGV